jgi:hypothetical protein
MIVDPLQPLMDALRSVWPQADHTSLVTATDQLLRGQSATLGASTASLTFGQGNTFDHATVTIGNIAGGNITNLTINFPQPINLQAASLQHLLYHHESATIFANRLDTFVGREAEIAEIRQRIAQIMPTGGYVTITAQAGEGKSSVIAQMVSQDGPDQTAFHFIALTPGREYQLSLLRPIVARLILKHGLSTTYFPDANYPAMRDYFHGVLRQLSERGIQEVIYIDGLDQLEAEVGGTRDLSFLPNSPPPGIVLVLGTRPDDTLRPLEVLNRVDYALPRLTLNDFVSVLKNWVVGLPPAAVTQLYMSLEGNALYLTLAASELHTMMRADMDSLVRDIIAKPSNLFKLTLDRIKRSNERLWGRVIKPILGLLLVSQESLTAPLLCSILGKEHDDLIDGLDRLGGLVSQSSDRTYFLYHRKFRDYLMQPAADQPNRSFLFAQDDLMAWHQRLATWCLPDQAAISMIWENGTAPLDQDRRHYARHHAITHLVEGGEYVRLWAIIDDGVYGRRKRRFDPSNHLYALDLDRARDVAVQTDDLIHLWRSSLLRVSLTSQVDVWPDTLFLTMVYLGRIDEALRRVELVSDDHRKFTILIQLAPLLHGDTAQQVWERVHIRVNASVDNGHRADAFLRLADAQVRANHPAIQETFARALDAITTIPDTRQRADAFLRLADVQVQTNHPAIQETFARALDAITAILDGRQRADEFLRLADVQVQANHPAIQETFARALDAITTIRDTRQRTNAFLRLADVQVQANHPAIQETFARALDAITTIRDTRQRADGFIRLGRIQLRSNHQSACETLALAQTTVTAFSNDEQGFFVINDLIEAQAQAGLWTEIQNTITALSNDMYRSYALVVLAKAQINAELWAEGYRTANAIPRASYRTKMLTRLALALTLAKHRDASACLAHAQSTIEHVDAQNLPHALLELAEAQAQANHADALLTFARARTFINSISDVYRRAAKLGSLAMALARINHPEAPSTFVQARSIINSILAKEKHFSFSESERVTAALALMASDFAEAGFWVEARMTIDIIPDDRERSDSLYLLTNRLRQAKKWAEAGITADSIPHTNTRLTALSEVALALAQSNHPMASATFDRAYSTTKTVPHTSQDILKTLIKLAQAQAQTNISDASTTFVLIGAILDAIPNEGTRATILHALVEDHTEARRWSDALAAAHSISSKGSRSEALRVVAQALIQAQLWAKAQMTIDRIPFSWEKAKTLPLLATALTQSQQWSEARSVACTIPNKLEQVKALSALAVAYDKNNISPKNWRRFWTFNPDARLWTLARRRTMSIPNKYERALALSTLALAFAQVNHANTIATFARAKIVADTIPEKKERVIALSLLAVAQTQAHYGDPLGTFAHARVTADTIFEEEQRDEALQELASAQIKAGLWVEARATADAILKEEQHAKVLQELAGAQIKAGLWVEARATADAILKDRERDESLRDLALAQIKEGLYMEAQITIDALADYWYWNRDEVLSHLVQAFAQAGLCQEARTIAETISRSEYRAVAFKALHTALICKGDIRTVYDNICAIWRQTQTTDDLLVMAAVATPLFDKLPDLGRAMVEAFAWVDDQLREG